jgi:hypothetical protein
MSRINDNRMAFLSPITPRWQEVFYSSIPVLWNERPDCSVCLPCARDEFEPPSGEPLVIDGVIVK